MRIIEFDENKLVNTDLEKLLYSKLLAIWDHKMWALGVMDSLRNEVDIKKMLKIIDAGETDTDEILLSAGDIEDGKL